MIYNCPNLNENPEVKKLYNKTHGYTDPGQQKDREYVNLPFDQKEHRYGYVESHEKDGASKSLNTDGLFAPYPRTKIVDKRLEDFRQANENMLGISKFGGALSSNIPLDHTFGKKSELGDAWNVGRCINGDGSTVTSQSMQVDPDLGRDRRYASKLQNMKPIERDPNKIYGIPSIRSDLKKKNFVSVCDLNNYGDEKDVYELLYPHPCATRGLDDEDFDQLMTKVEIKDILNKNNMIIPDEEFNLIWEIGIKNYPNTEGKLSSTAFINTMRNLKREYMKYRTLVDN